MKHVLGIGNALVDVMTQIDNDQILQEFGLPKGSMTLVDIKKSLEVKNSTLNFKRSLASGGSAANTIHGLSMLHPGAGFIGSIGKDETGDFFENDMKKAGVRTVLTRRNTPTGTALALVSPDSERTFATFLGAAVELGTDDLREEYFTPYDILYLEGYLINDRSLVEKACSMAKENSMEVALDLASFNVVNAHKKDFTEIAEKYVDIIFANEEEARAFTGSDPEKALDTLSMMCKIAIVKTGKEGSLVKRGEEKVRITAMPVDCMDTTGAGDLYAAGFLHGYAKSLPLDMCGVIGSILAGNVIELIGARIPESKWPQIREQISNVTGG